MQNIPSSCPNTLHSWWREGRPEPGFWEPCGSPWAIGLHEVLAGRASPGCPEGIHRAQRVREEPPTHTLALVGLPKALEGKVRVFWARCASDSCLLAQRWLSSPGQAAL